MNAEAATCRTAQIDEPPVAGQGACWICSCCCRFLRAEINGWCPWKAIPSIGTMQSKQCRFFVVFVFCCKTFRRNAETLAQVCQAQPPAIGNTWDLRLMCFFSTGFGCRSAPTIKGECERFPQHVKMSRGKRRKIQRLGRRLCNLLNR